MIQLLAFDLDGTLFDTAHGISKAFNSVLQSRGESPVPHETISAFIGTGLRSLLAQLDDKLQHRLGDLAQLEIDFKYHYNQIFLDESSVYPGIVEFLQNWPHQIAVVSNKSEYYVHELIALKELQYFKWSSLIGGDTYSEKKPHPMPLLSAMKLANVACEQTLMIGDGLPDIQVALNTNVKSVAVEFGYTPISQLIQEGAHASIASYKDLPNIIESLS